MTLRKITTDNCVRFVPKSEQTKEKEIKPKTIKCSSRPCYQDKIFSINIKKFVKDFAAGVFGILKRITNCYFHLKNIQKR